MKPTCPLGSHSGAPFFCIVVQVNANLSSWFSLSVATCDTQHQLPCIKGVLWCNAPRRLNVSAWFISVPGLSPDHWQPAFSTYFHIQLQALRIVSHTATLGQVLTSFFCISLCLPAKFPFYSRWLTSTSPWCIPCSPLPLVAAHQNP